MSYFCMFIPESVNLSHSILKLCYKSIIFYKYITHRSSLSPKERIPRKTHKPLRMVYLNRFAPILRKKMRSYILQKNSYFFRYFVHTVTTCP